MDEYGDYGKCEGPHSMYVKLISKDGHEFVVKRELALMSGTIKDMLSGPGLFAENQANEISLKEIPSLLLKKVCMYLMYKYQETKNLGREIGKFHIEPELAYELMLVSTFLDC